MSFARKTLNKFFCAFISNCEEFVTTFCLYCILPSLSPCRSIRASSFNIAFSSTFITVDTILTYSDWIILLFTSFNISIVCSTSSAFCWGVFAEFFSFNILLSRKSIKRGAVFIYSLKASPPIVLINSSGSLPWGGDTTRISQAYLLSIAEEIWLSSNCFISPNVDSVSLITALPFLVAFIPAPSVSKDKNILLDFV